MELRKNVNNYFKEKNISTKGNWRMVLKSIAMLSLYLAPFIAILFAPITGWIILPLFAMMGIGMAGIGMSVMHDAAHGSSTEKKWLNRLLSQTIYMIGGSVFTWNIQHNVKHHTYTNITGHDEDINTKAIIRLSAQAPLKKIHRFQHIYAFAFYTLMTIAKLFNDFGQLSDYNKTGYTQKQNAKPAIELTRLIFFKMLYLFVFIGLPILLGGFNPVLVLIGFLIMHLIAGGIMSIVFQMAHIAEGVDQPVLNTDGNIENEWAIHELETTANFAKNNRLLGWFIGGLNFQIEHHLFPNICHVHYRNISPIVEKTAKDFGLNYNVKSSFLKAIVSHTKTLKVLGRKAE
jgi:linoleoyl-CoA desaturase